MAGLFIECDQRSTQSTILSKLESVHKVSAGLEAGNVIPDLAVRLAATQRDRWTDKISTSIRTIQVDYGDVAVSYQQADTSPA